MDIRETLLKNSKLSLGLVAALIVIPVIIIVFETTGRHGYPPGVSTQAFFTTEDNLTGDAAVNALFVDDVNKVPPFDHNGKPAYRAMVYSCNNGKTKWVNSLKRYTPDMRAKVESFVNDAVAKGAATGVDTADFDTPGIEVKMPGPGPWINYQDPASRQALTVRVPDGVNSDDLTFATP